MGFARRPVIRGIAGIRIPDSSFVSHAIAMRNSLRVPGSLGPLRVSGTWVGVLWGFVVALSFGHQLQAPRLRPLWQI